MKTVYIPTGTEVSHMNLATGHLVVDGSLTITGTLKAKTIGGRGFVEAGTVSADGIRVDDLKAVSVTCRRLYAKRVEASQIFASEGIDVSCFLGADRVVTPRLAMALSDIDEVTGLSGADRKRLILCGGDELRGRKSRYDNFRQSIEPSTYRGLKLTFSVLYRSSNTDWIAVSKNVGSSDVSTRVSNTQGKFELATISVAVSSTAALGFFAVMRTTKGAQTGIDLIAAKLELGDHQTLAHQDEDGNWVLNDPPDYALQYALCSLYSPITGEWIGNQHSNPNLLDNWYFADPINQRGQSEYAPTKYAIDRWRTVRTTLQAADGYVKLVPGDLSANNGYISQRVENPDIIGKKVTISALTAEGRLYTLTGTPTEKTALAVYTGDVFLCVDCAYLPEYKNSPIIAAGVNRNANISELNLVAVKLEFGSVQTLAHQDEDGNWVLNDPPPNKALELAKCQRYQLEVPAGSQAVCQRILSNVISFFVPTPVSLRANPKLTGDFSIRTGSNNTHNGFTFECFKKPNGVIINCTKTTHGITIGDSPILVCGSAGMLDANL